MKHLCRQGCISDGIMGRSVEENVAYQNVTIFSCHTYSHRLTSPSAHAVAGPDNTILVSNLEDGVDVYTSPPTRLLKSHSFGKQHFRQQLCTISGGAFIVTGSEQGKPLILSPNGQLKQALPHGSTLVPIVTVGAGNPASTNETNHRAGFTP